MNAHRLLPQPQHYKFILQSIHQFRVTSSSLPHHHQQYCRSFSISSARMSRVSDVIIHDHRELEEYHNNIVNASTDDDKVRWRNQFTWELARHSIGEELVVYPVIEKSVPNGVQIADKDRAEHNKVLLPSRMVVAMGGRLKLNRTLTF